MLFSCPFISYKEYFPICLKSIILFRITTRFEKVVIDYESTQLSILVTLQWKKLKNIFRGQRESQ